MQSKQKYQRKITVRLLTLNFDLLPWRCLIDTHQQLFHGLPPETSVVRHVSSGLQVNVHHKAVVFYHIDPSFLWSPSTPVAVDMTVHDYAGKSVLTHSDYMAEIYFRRLC